MKPLRIISLLLCVMLIIPMLFACNKKDKKTDGSKDAEAAPSPTEEVLLPDCRCDVIVNLDVMIPGNSQLSQTYMGTSSICISGDDFMISEVENGMAMSVIFCDNVLYANLYGEKYKIDFNSFDIETVLGMLLGMLSSSAYDVGSEPMDLYGSAPGQFGERAPIYGNEGNFMFQSIDSIVSDDGTQLTVYKGLQPKVAAIIDELICAVMENFTKPYADIVIDYDTLQLSVWGKDENVSFSLDFDLDYMESNVTVAECRASVRSQCRIGDIEPITAPKDADEYENALPLIMSEFMGKTPYAEVE